MREKFYIFLDIDGVFWDYKWLKEEINAGRIQKGGVIRYFNPKSVEAFNYLLEKLSINFDIEIVITSTYRSDMQQLMEMFLWYKLNLKHVSNIIPLKNLSMRRDAEILAFIKENRVNNYLIIDDDDNNSANLFKKENIIKTNIYNCSLSLKLVKNALKSLKNSEKSEEN